jgi:hypothetical protein
MPLPVRYVLGSASQENWMTWSWIFGGEFHARVSRILDIERHIIHVVVIEHIGCPVIFARLPLMKSA